MVRGNYGMPPKQGYGHQVEYSLPNSESPSDEGWLDETKSTEPGSPPPAPTDLPPASLIRPLGENRYRLRPSIVLSALVQFGCLSLTRPSWECGGDLPGILKRRCSEAIPKFSPRSRNPCGMPGPGARIDTSFYDNRLVTVFAWPTAGAGLTD